MSSEQQPSSDPGKTEVRLPAVTVSTELKENHFLALAAVLALALGHLTVSLCIAEPLLMPDDGVYISSNTKLDDKSSWSDVVLSAHYAQYTPVTIASYKVNVALFGRDAVWSFRAVNWLIHAGSALLLLYVLIVMGFTRWEALFVALAWVAHPMACESTAWASERNNVLAFFFGIAALLVYAKYHGSWTGLLGGAGLLLLALLSKPTALNWIPIFIAYEALGGPYKLGFERAHSDVGNSGGMGIRLIPLLLLGIGFAIVGMYAHRLGQITPPGGSVVTALCTDTEIATRYIMNTLAPVQLSGVYHVADIESPGDTRLYLYLFALAAAVAPTVLLARNRNRAAFGWLWFFLGFATNANVVSISVLMADRFVYIASAGLLIVLVEFVKGLAGRMAPSGDTAMGGVPEPKMGVRKALAGVAAVYVLLLGIQATARSHAWRSPIALFEEAVERQPESSLARFYLATSYAYAVNVYETKAEQAAWLLRMGKLPPAEADKVRKEAEAEAKKHDELIVKAIGEGLKQQDAYRYFDPLGIRVKLARSAVRLGQGDAARAALEGYLPPPTHPDGAKADLNEQLFDRGFRAMRYQTYDKPYHYMMNTLAQAYAVAAEAELAAFVDGKTSAADARKHLERAIDFASQASESQARLLSAHIAKALALLARGVLEGPDGQAEDRLRQARDWIARAKPNMDNFHPNEKSESGDPDQPIPSALPIERLKAWGLLAVAESMLNEAQHPRLDPAKAGALCLDAAKLTQQALATDATCYDALFLESRIHMFLDQLAEKRKDLAASHEHYKKTKELLNKVPPIARRYEMAQQHLKNMQPPPPLPEKKDEPKPEQKTEQKTGAKAEVKTESKSGAEIKTQEEQKTAQPAPMP